MVVGEWAVGQVFFSMLWFFLFFIWIYILIVVFADIFRSNDLSGWAKALWVIFVVVLPYLGVFVYLIARGGQMARRGAQAQQRSQEQLDAYVRSAAGTGHPSVAAELEQLAKLRDQGTITEEEFAALKSKALAAA
jgi:ABC-type multidrug transport system fused ATPase/permease subunit